MNSNSISQEASGSKKERNFPALDLKDQATLSTDNQPVLVIQSPKTPTLSRKLKAVSLDSEPQQQANSLEISRDVFSMPNTPKKQLKKLSCDFEDGPPKTLAPNFNSNLKKFASNNSISGSQTLKTLPEINALQDFSDCPNTEPPRIRSKGLLERRGSNASLTIDLGSSQSIAEVKPAVRLKSVSTLDLSSVDEKCACVKKVVDLAKIPADRRKSQEACNNCTIYESETKIAMCRSKCQNLKRCHGCAKSRRKSLSNENLYVPPCGFCDEGRDNVECRNGKGNNRKALFPRQPELESAQRLSDDFKLHLQNIQYLQTAGKTMSIDDLKQSSVAHLQQEFWEVPLNLQEKCYVSGSQSKNRYRGVLPNEHSRVLLPSGGYIHANYIKGPDYTDTAYIATQGPLSHTCSDFWEMVWYSQCQCIVMLTGLVEKGRNKCELYFPLGKKSDTKEKTFFYVKTPKVRDKFTFDLHINTNTYDIETYEFEEKNEVIFGKFKVTYLGERNLDQCQIRRLELRKMDVNVEPRVIQHYWLANWPDHKKTSAEQVLKMAMEVLSCLDNRKADISESMSTCASTSTEPQTKQSDLTYSIDRMTENTVTTSESVEIVTQSLETVTSRTFSYTIKSECTRQSDVKSRENSISDFNKETLANRCSLDSKLQNFAHISNHERRKSAEHIGLPIICHCSAGIGRTGCFLAILNGIQQLRANNNVDVLAILCSLRLNRGGMVQTAEQYDLIHRVLSLYSESCCN